MKLIPTLATALLCAASTCKAQIVTEAAKNASWTRTRIDPKFRSEGAAIADINRDGKNDVLVGDYWYQAPNWERKEIRKPGDYGDGNGTYSKAFCVFSDDVNKDGWADQIVVGFPGEAALWYENPQNKDGHWKERVISPSACNESPQYVDIFKDGQKRLVMGVQPEGQVVWLSPDADLEKPWVRHAISEKSTKDLKIPGTDRFDHGLGVGDLNGDGRNDVLTHRGWWEQPDAAKTTDAPWTWHPAALGEECADMLILDVDKDGKNDVISSSAHSRGVWWHRQAPESPNGWQRETISNTFTQSHALHWVDGKVMATGKRYWAHGPTGDADPGAPAVTVMLEPLLKAGGGVAWLETVVDDQTGIGTQFAIGDMNNDGKKDIVVSNKKGVTILMRK